jgi:hypothetical protein
MLEFFKATKSHDWYLVSAIEPPAPHITPHLSLNKKKIINMSLVAALALISNPCAISILWAKSFPY